MSNETAEPSREGQLPDQTSLMAAVEAIVEAVLARQGTALASHKQSRWKAAQRPQGSMGLAWRRADWHHT